MPPGVTCFIRSRAAEAGRPFDLDNLAITARERLGVPTAAYEKASARGDGIIKETLGGETLGNRLLQLWPVERSHLPVAEIAEWFATYVYLPKLRDRVVLEAAIRDALAKLDPKFAYADDFDEPSGSYVGLLWQKAPAGTMPATAVLVQPDIALKQLRKVAVPANQPILPPILTPVPRSVRDRCQTHNQDGSMGRSRLTWCVR